MSARKTASGSYPSSFYLDIDLCVGLAFSEFCDVEFKVDQSITGH